MAAPQTGISETEALHPWVNRVFPEYHHCPLNEEGKKGQVRKLLTSKTYLGALKEIISARLLMPSNKIIKTNQKIDRSIDRYGILLFFSR